jgi:uncharacterized protein with GYD domain
MPKYLYQSSYTVEGLKGLMKDGGSKRKQVAQKLVESLGGKLEAFYYAFGGTDVYLIVDAPDNASAAAGAIAVTAAGGASIKTTVLITPEEMDAATKKGVSYSPPGG